MNNKLEAKKVPFLGAELMEARDAKGQIWSGVRWTRWVRPVFEKGV